MVVKQVKWGDFWLVNLDGGVGSEQSGVRPCVVILNDIGNQYSGTTIVCPLTTKSKNYSATHLTVGCLAKESYIMCEQMRVVDKSRLIKYLCSTSQADAEKLKEKLRITLSL